MTAVPVPPAAPDLDHLDQLRAAATPGPWQLWHDAEPTFPTGLGAWATDRQINVVDYSGQDEDDWAFCRADAALIVAAVNALPALTAEVRRLRATVAAVTALADEGDRMHRTVRTDRLRAVVATAQEAGQ